MKENLNLRCYTCSYEFIKLLETIDKIYEVICPKCFKKTVEIDMGKNKHTENDYGKKDYSN